MGKLLVVLLFIGAGIGVYQVFKDFKEKQRLASNTWPQQIAPIITHHVSRNILEGKSLAGEQTFFRLMYAISQIKRDGFPVISNLTDAAKNGGASSSEAAVMAAALAANYQRGEQLGIFADPLNLVKMERGESPVAKAQGWEEEPIAVGFLISPTLGGELAFLPSNMVLMPEVVRNMQSNRLPPDANKLYMPWLTMGMITPKTANAIRDQINDEQAAP